MKRIIFLMVVSICIMVVGCGKFEGGLYATKTDAGYIISNYLGFETNVVIPSEIDGIPVVAIDDTAFINKNIQSIEIPSSVKSIGEKAFFGCHSLEEIVLSDNIEKIGLESFCFCESLKSIKLPAKLKKIESHLFGNCFSLSSIEFPAQLEEIGDSAFFACTGLQSIELPDSVKIIGKEGFYRCEALMMLKLSESLISIGSYAFANLYSLSEIRIPASVKKLEDSVFSMSLMKIVFEGNAPEEVHQDVFNGYSKNRIYYVPGTTGWPEPGMAIEWYGVYTIPEGEE